MSKTFRWLIVFLQAIFGIYLIRWVLLHAGLTIEQVIVQVAQVSPIPLMFGFMFFIAAIGLRAFRYKLFLSPAVPLKYIWGITLFQNAFITFFPWPLGEASYPFLLRRDYKISVNQSAATIFAVRSIDFIIILASVVWGLSRIKLGRISLSGLVLPASFGMILVISFAVIWPGVARSAVRNLKEWKTSFITPPRFAAYLVLSIVIYLSAVYQSMFILEAVSLKVAFTDLIIVNGVTLLSALIPIHPPGGWGTIDSIQVIIFNQLGYLPTVTTQAVLIAHTIYTLIILFGGLVGWLLRNLDQKYR